jgi:FtsH-binding integral membrane protein
MDIHNLKIQSEYVQMDLYMNFYNIFVSLSDSHMNSKKMIHII